MIAAIATAAIYVDDQTRSLEFWTEQVGFRVHRSLSMGPNAAWIEVGPDGAQSCLVLYPRAMMSDAAERKPSIVFTCENIEQTYQEMSELLNLSPAAINARLTKARAMLRERMAGAL